MFFCPSAFSPRPLFQLLQQRLGVLQVAGVEAFREPLADGGEELAERGDRPRPPRPPGRVSPLAERRRLDGLYPQQHREELGQGPDVARHVLPDSRVAGVAFTGSTEVGRLFLKYSAESNLKRITLECGGKSPAVVLSEPLLELLSEAEVQAVYAHEVAHLEQFGAATIPRRVYLQRLDDALARPARLHA